MSQNQVTFVEAGTLGEPTKIEVRKDERAIGRILHVGEAYEFHKGMTSMALHPSAQYPSLEALKKWIRETQ
jgi:hypothetical protein